MKLAAVVVALAACGYSRPPDVGPVDGNPAGDADAVDAAADAAASCAGHEQCYASDTYCEGSCQAPDTACPNAMAAAAKMPNGPLLFQLAQTDRGEHGWLCRRDANCGGGTSGRVCELVLRYYDPQADMTGGSAVNRVKLVDREGAHGPTFDVPFIGPDTIAFRGCFSDGVDPNGAIQVFDLAGNVSNALCIRGIQSYPACNLFVTGECSGAQRCAWRIDDPTTLDGHIGCAPEGTAAVGQSCSYNGGASDCVAFSECVDGLCRAICDTEDDCDAVHTCITSPDRFVNASGAVVAGVCMPQ